MGRASAYIASLKFGLLAGFSAGVVGLTLRLLFPAAFAGLSIGLTVVLLIALPFALGSIFSSFVALATDRYEAYALIPGLQAVLAFTFAVSGAVFFDLNGAVMGLALSTIAVGVGSIVWGCVRLPRLTSRPGGLQMRRVLVRAQGLCLERTPVGQLPTRSLLSLSNGDDRGRRLLRSRCRRDVGSLAATSCSLGCPLPAGCVLSTGTSDAERDMVETEGLRLPPSSWP